MIGSSLALVLTLASNWLWSVALIEQPFQMQMAALSLESLENPPPSETAPEVDPPADLEAPESEDSPEDNASEGENVEGENVRPYAPLRSYNACPTDPATLSAALIRDIPNYTNRVLQRTTAVLPDNMPDNNSTDSEANPLIRRAYRPSYVLVAGSLDLEPLNLNDYAFTTAPEAGGPLTQVFLTTLSRQYSGLRFNEVQEYHWLFLAEADDGWWLAFMFSSLDNAEGDRGAFQGNRVPLPPRENSRGSVGQAVQLWLRDCRAGTIEPVK